MRCTYAGEARVRVEALSTVAERGMRSGTLNVAGIVGMGKAAEVALKKLEAEQNRTTNFEIRCGLDYRRAG